MPLILYTKHTHTHKHTQCEAIASNKSCIIHEVDWNTSPYGCILNSAFSPYTQATWEPSNPENACIIWNTNGANAMAGYYGYGVMCRLDMAYNESCSCNLADTNQVGVHNSFLRDACGDCGGDGDCDSSATVPTTDSPTTTTTDSPTTTQTPLDVTESYVLGFEIDIVLDTNTCGDVLTVSGGENALRETVSQITGAAPNNIRNVSIVGGDCRRRRRFLQSQSDSFGKYQLRYIILTNSSTSAAEVQNEIQESVDDTLPEFAREFVENLVRELGPCDQSSSGSNMVHWEYPVYITNNVVMFPVVVDISIQTATILNNAIKVLGTSDGSYECQNFQGIFIAICDGTSVLAIADIIKTEKVISTIISSPDRSYSNSMQNVDDSMSTPEILVLVGIGVAIISTLSFIIVAFYKYKRRLSRDEVFLKDVRYQLEAAKHEQLLLAQGWKLKWDEIDLGDKIGMGASGEVYAGSLRSSLDVAVKLFKRSSDDHYSENEISAMRRCRHPRLVMFLGYGRVDKDSMFIVMEHMNMGGMNKRLWYVIFFLVIFRALSLSLSLSLSFSTHVRLT